MPDFNQFSTYGLSFQGAGMSQKDKVDTIVDEIIDMDMFDDVQAFVKNYFGDVEGAQWFEYPELNKSVYVLNESEKIEICMLKNHKQYYGKGWIPLYKK